MMEHPILINRPIVITPTGVKLAALPKLYSTFCLSRKRGNSVRRMANWLSRPTVSDLRGHPHHNELGPRR
jgi:hypothetical protein